MLVSTTCSDDNPLHQVGLLTSKVWHVYSLEQMAGEQASQMADMEDGLQQTSNILPRAMQVRFLATRMLVTAVSIACTGSLSVYNHQLVYLG